MKPPLDSQDDLRWQAVLQRDGQHDGSFVFAVSTTGVFCRPSCHSRIAKRENVRFFDNPANAVAQGFRPCKRCRPDQDQFAPAIELVTQVSAYIATHVEAPELLTRAALGQQFHLSPGHLQTVFKQVTGLTPAQHARAVRQQRLRDALAQEATATGAVFTAGYSSMSQAYGDGGILGMTPRQYQRKGEGMAIHYVTLDTAYGCLLVGATDRGLCVVSLHDDADSALTSLRAEFGKADLMRDETELTGVAQQIVAHITGSQPSLDLPMDVQATAFQVRVWQALRQIPRGETRSYSEVAAQIGDPKATRAVAAACGANHLAIVVPCHRVVGKSGNLTGYKWGVERKRKLLAHEKDQRDLFD